MPWTFNKNLKCPLCNREIEEKDIDRGVSFPCPHCRKWLIFRQNNWSQMFSILLASCVIVWFTLRWKGIHRSGTAREALGLLGFADFIRGILWPPRKLEPAATAGQMEK
jgi:predicted RNA-binding Zn-ribbon protein involved in translation (DUF1610 family)